MRINICDGNLGTRSNVRDSVHVVCEGLFVKKVGGIGATIMIKTLLVVRSDGSFVRLRRQLFGASTYSCLREYGVICDPMQVKYKSIGVNTITDWIRYRAAI